MLDAQKKTSMSDYTMRRNCKLIGKLPSGDMNARSVVEH